MSSTYITKLTLVSAGMENRFLLGQRRTCYNGVYPYKIFPEKELRETILHPLPFSTEVTVPESPRY